MGSDGQVPILSPSLTKHFSSAGLIVCVEISEILLQELFISQGAQDINFIA